jgi:DNA-binding transcriptional ArsR family regulator
MCNHSVTHCDGVIFRKGNSSQMIASEPEVPDVYRALADPTRRAILDLLRSGNQPVGSIASSFQISRPAVSKHLSILRDARLVVEIKEGRHRICQLDAAPMLEVKDWLDRYEQFWKANLRSLKKFVESREKSKD